LTLYNQNPDDAANGWKLKVKKEFGKDGYNLKLWQKKNAAGGVDWIRLSSTMKDIPRDGIMNYYRNPPIEKMKMIKEMRVIETIPE
jgi:hypothetical protein